MTTEHEEMVRKPAGLFWRYWAATTISTAGSSVTLVALPLTAVLVLDATPLEVSLVTAAGYAAWIVLGLPAGVITQQFPLRAMQVVMDLSRALAIGSIPLVWWLGHLTVGQLVLVALVISFANVLFDVSNSTFVPAVVDRADLTTRNSLLSGTGAVTQLGGPSLGGVLVQLFGGAPALLVDAVSYVLSAALLRTLPEGIVERTDDASRRTGAMIREGWQFVTRHPVMRPCMVLATVANFVCSGLLALIPVYLVRELHQGPGVVGVLIAMDGVGSLLGASLTPRLNRSVGSARAVFAASFALVALALLMPDARSLAGVVLFGVGNAGVAAASAVISVNTRTYRQVASPPQLLARVMATVRFASWGVMPFGALAAGLAATSIGSRGALWIFCGLTVLAPLLLLGTPVGRLRDLTDHEESVELVTSQV